MKRYSAKDLAVLFKKDIKTIQRWDRDGVLVAKRTPTNRRFYTQEQVNFSSNHSSQRPFGEIWLWLV